MSARLPGSMADLEAKLQDVLEEVADSGDAAALAYQQIMEAVGDYNMMRPPVRDGGEWVPGTAPSKAGQKYDMAGVANALERAHNLIHNLPFESRRLLARAAGLTFQELDGRLLPLVAAARAATAKADASPKKPSNFARNHLARDVARIMRDTLGVEPKQTLDDPGVVRSRGGGQYARILHATLEVVGIKQASIGADMREGLRLLNDREGARGDRLAEVDPPE